MDETEDRGIANSVEMKENPPKELQTKETQLENIPPPTEEEEDPRRQQVQTIDIPETWKKLSEEHEIWLDMKNKQVIAAGDICLVRGGLEMFVCLMGTKEHESVIAVNAQAFQVHAALLAIGAKPGKPVQWEPYQPVTGSKIRVEVMWKEGDKRVTRNGKEMVRNFETKKELDVDWVFGGSFMEKHPDDGSNIYYAEGGELVCVSNFSSATMDLPIESSQTDLSLLFEANTEKLPPLGTKVYVVFSEINDSGDQSEASSDPAAENQDAEVAVEDEAASDSRKEKKEGQEDDQKGQPDKQDDPVAGKKSTGKKKDGGADPDRGSDPVRSGDNQSSSGTAPY